VPSAAPKYNSLVAMISLLGWLGDGVKNEMTLLPDGINKVLVVIRTFSVGDIGCYYSEFL
jgi:hypothetical protein